MEAIELKIGNYVDVINRNGDIHIPMGGIKQIGGIGLITTALFEPYLPWAQQQFTTNVGIRDLSPIKLTEEWLIKFGFSKMEYRTLGKDCFYDDNFYTINFLYESMVFYIEHLETNINYVHQLQNLYYSLTGIELKIK